MTTHCAPYIDHIFVELTNGNLVVTLEALVLGASRAEVPILTPREKYERVGDINNVVFASGAILEPDGSLKVYYGAADTCICVATVSFASLMTRCGVT